LIIKLNTRSKTKMNIANNPHSLNLIPKHWAISKMSDLVVDPTVDLVDGPFGSNLKAKDFKKAGIPVFKIQNIKAGYFLDKKIDFVTEEKAVELSRHSFNIGDIIITKLGEPLGLCCKVPTKYPYGIIVADLIRLRPNSEIINSDYLVYAINSAVLQRQFEEITKGTTRSRVNLGAVRELLVPLPPLLEQKAIVDKIDELFSDLDNGKRILEKAQQQISPYKQLILKKAFQGDLTADWRVNNPGFTGFRTIVSNLLNYDNYVGGKKYVGKKQVLLNADFLTPKRTDWERWPKLPENWGYVYNDLMLRYVTSGSRDWKKYYSSTGALFIRTQDINTNALSKENIAHVKLPDTIEGKRSLVEQFDLLMTITGANVGKVAHIDTEIEEAYVSQSVALMKYRIKSFSKFAYYYFQTTDFGKTFVENMVYGVGRPVLNLQNMRDVPMVICSEEEQLEIVKIIESRFSFIEKVEETLSRHFQSAEILKKNILKQAFQGKLVEEMTEELSGYKLIEKALTKRELHLKSKNKSKKKMAKKPVKILPNKSTIDLIYESFSYDSFEFKDLKVRSELEYEDLRDDLYALLENGSVEKYFDENEEVMKYKIIVYENTPVKNS